MLHIAKLSKRAAHFVWGVKYMITNVSALLLRTVFQLAAFINLSKSIVVPLHFHLFVYLNKISSRSGALACKATRSGDERPHDSIGMSMNLKNLKKNIYVFSMHVSGMKLLKRAKNQYILSICISFRVSKYFIEKNIKILH